MEIIFILIGLVALYFGGLSFNLLNMLTSFYSENKRLQTLADSNQNSQNNADNSQLITDHSFAKRVADEIVRMQTNLSRMDESIKGFKQLNASVRKLEQSLNSNHYQLEDLLNKAYDNGMNLQATFIEDENLKEGESIITRIIKPQINYKGKLIQAAQIEVSQGL
jgi:exonuclease VII small subunit